MKVTGRKSISCVIKIILQLIFVIGIIILALAPFYGWYFLNVISPMFPMLLFGYPLLVYITGIPAVILVYQFIKLFDSLEKETPFIEENAKTLKVASYNCAAIAILYLPLVVLSIFNQAVGLTLFTGILFIVFVIGWIGLFILSQLFAQAVGYKKENDLTI